MVEAAGGVENGAGRNLDVGDLESALRHTVGNNPGDLIDQAILVAIDGLAGLSRQRQVGRKRTGVAIMAAGPPGASLRSPAAGIRGPGHFRAAVVPSWPHSP